MTQLATVPNIDISPLFGNDVGAKRNIGHQIHQACRGSGFFYATNHGVDVNKLQDVVNTFHRTMTDEEKWDLAINAYNKNNQHNRNGYYMAIPGKKAVESYCYLNPYFNNEHPMIKDRVPAHEVNIWPDSVKHSYFRSFCENYYYDMCHLTSKLLQGFALALGKTLDFFEPHFRLKDNLSAVSLIRYPYLKDYPPTQIKTAPDGTKLGFEDHLDASLITILFQTPVPNLQVEIGDEWQDIPISSENFLVNCGTYMPHITNNYFHAPNHRVKHINTERLSLPFFVNLCHDSKIQPFNPYNIESQIDNLAISYGDYLQKELRALIIKNGQT